MEETTAAPGTEDATGQGTEGSQVTSEGGAPADYAGFQTPEELAQAYQTTVQEQEALRSQISNLESLKGRHGNEIGQLRHQLAQLTGQIEGMRSVQSQAPVNQGPTLDDIASELQDGKIDEAQALKLASQVTERQVTTRLGQEFKQMLHKEIGAFQQQTAQERAIEKFLQDNPGYEEAFDSGKLDPWLTINADGSKSGGQEAWKEYQFHLLKTENEQLKKTAAEKAAAAEKAGIDKGLDLAKSKTNAGKVLSGKGGQFSQAAGKYDLTNPRERRAAAVERLNQIRSGAG